MTYYYQYDGQSIGMILTRVEVIECVRALLQDNPSKHPYAISHVHLATVKNDESLAMAYSKQDIAQSWLRLRGSVHWAAASAREASTAGSVGDCWVAMEVPQLPRKTHTKLRQYHQCQ